VFFGNGDLDLLKNDWWFSRDCDRTIDLDWVPEGMPGQHIVEAYAGRAGVTLDPYDWKPHLFFDSAAADVARALLPSGTRYALIHSGEVHGWSGRQWPFDKFKMLCGELKKMGLEPVQVRAHADRELGVRELAGLDFTALCACMSRATLFVGLDSMPFHVAQAFRIPSVAIFGCIRPEARVIPGLPVRPVFVDGLYCLGCHHRQLGKKLAITSCPEGHEKCMRDLEVERVVREVGILMEGEQR
jgi:ADP-heptose:LPS heptosyltransferase